MATSDSTTKQCSKCKVDKPATLEFFRFKMDSSDNLYSYCHDCQRVYNREYRKARKARDPEYHARMKEQELRRIQGDEKYERIQATKFKKAELVSQGLRRCISGNKCFHPDGPILPATDDYFEIRPVSHTRDGMRSRCRVCVNVLGRPRMEKYRAKNSGNPVVKLKHDLSNMRVISNRRKLPFNFTEDDWFYCLDYWNHRCCICNRPVGLWHTLAKEHWIPCADKRIDNPGTVPWNILPMCHSRKGGENECNNAKNATDPVKWLKRRIGKRAAKKKLAEIEAYFATVRK